MKKQGTDDYLLTNKVQMITYLPLNDSIEKLIEQVRIANNYRFGKHTETLKSIEGQLSFFDEAEAACDEPFGEPSAEEVLPAKHRAKKKGQRDLDLKDFPEEILPPYSVSEEQLDAFYGKGDWRRMPDETGTAVTICHAV